MRTHILFGELAGLTLKQAFKSNQINEQVVILVDDLMWGPLGNIMLEHVQAERLKWWENVLNDEEISVDIPYLRDSYLDFNEWVNALTDKDSLLFWVGDDATEYTGLMCLLTYIPKTISMAVIMASGAYYQRYRKFKPRSVGEISPDKISTLMEDAKPLSPRVRERYIQNWMQLLKDNGTLRIRKNRQIETVSDDYFDEEIITRAKRISKEKMYYKSDGFLPTARLVGDIIGNQKQRIMDVLIEWRIRCLIQKGLLVYQGSLTNIRLYSIKPVLD